MERKNFHLPFETGTRLLLDRYSITNSDSYLTFLLRLTEIWCVPPETDEELGTIMITALQKGKIDPSIGAQLVKIILDFVKFLKATPLGEYIVFSIRDALAYADYLIAFQCSGIDFATCIIHAARAVHLDSLGSGAGLAFDEVRTIRAKAEEYIFNVAESEFKTKVSPCAKIEKDDTKMVVDDFHFESGPLPLGGFSNWCSLLIR